MTRPLRLHRRQFLAQASAAGALLTLGDRYRFDRSTPNGFKKAVKIGMVQAKKSPEGATSPLTLVDKFRLLKKLGYDGVELDAPSDLTADDVREAKKASGLEVHGVVDSVHWQKPLSHPDASVRAEGLSGLRTAIRDAKAFGASSVLLVPALVNADISYDAAWNLSQAEIRKVLPEAESAGISILFENVWNNFLLSPLEMARYIDGFESPVVGAYFDVGNVVKFGWPEQWIRILGRRIKKLDIKEYSRGPKGFGVKLHEGDCGWPAVVKALRSIGYQGWATAEVPGGDETWLEDVAARMDRIFES